MRLLDLYAHMVEMVRNHYVFGKPPVDARVLLLEEMVESLCDTVDRLKDEVELLRSSK